MVYPLMGLLFLNSMADIRTFGRRDVNQDTVRGVQRRHPCRRTTGSSATNGKAYEQAQAERRQAEKVRSLEDFAPSPKSDTDRVKWNCRTASRNRNRSGTTRGGGRLRRRLPGHQPETRLVLREPKVDGKGGAEKAGGGADRQTGKRERQAGGIDDQVALMKSYEACRQYGAERAGQRNRAGTATGQNGNGRTARRGGAGGTGRTVSGLRQPLSDAEFMRRYSQPRNYGFNTAVGSGYALRKNTIAACIHQDQTVMDGQQVKLRLLEPLQAGNLTIPQYGGIRVQARCRGNGSTSRYRPSSTKVTYCRWNWRSMTTRERAVRRNLHWNRKRQRRRWRTSAAGWERASRSHGRRATGGDGHHPWADAGRQPVPRQEVPHGKGAPESG